MADKIDMKLETVNIDDVEIFEIGTYNGVEMTDTDLKEMIFNFDTNVTEPYITIDHDEKTTEQFKDSLKALSLGFVKRLRQVGTKLVADFKQVPKTLGELIQAGALKKKSIEFYKKYIHADGRDFKNVLQGVTFHGANGSPAVTTLSDFLTLYKNDLKTTNIDEKNKITILKIQQETNMEISKEEYSELITFKKDADKNTELLTTLKADNESLSAQVTEKDETINNLKKIEAEYTVFKKTSEDKAEADLKDEADKYVKEQIDLKKIIPASKDMYVKNYITFKKASDEELKTFKDDIENRAELLKSASITNVEGDDTKATADNFEEVVKTKMKNGKTFDEARTETLAELEVSEV